MKREKRRRIKLLYKSTTEQEDDAFIKNQKKQLTFLSNLAKILFGQRPDESIENITHVTDKTPNSNGMMVLDFSNHCQENSQQFKSFQNGKEREGTNISRTPNVLNSYNFSHSGNNGAN